MFKKFSSALVFSVTFIFIAGLLHAANHPKYSPGHILIKLKNSVYPSASVLQNKTGIASIDTRNNKYQMKSIQPLFPSQQSAKVKATANQSGSDFGLDRIYLLTVGDAIDMVKACDDYKTDPNVEYAEPDYESQAVLTPNDPSFNLQYGPQKISAPPAWDTQTGANSIVIAIVDTGIDDLHPDLAANMWTNPKEIPGNGIDDDANGFVDDVKGWNFVTNTNNPKDDYGHGTHCAGIASGVGNNGVGIAGVSWNCKLMSVKGLGVNGSGLNSGLAQGILYAANNGAKVISNSWGGGGFSQVLSDAIDYAVNKGAVVICAAGNNSSESIFYPAGIENSIAVAATDANDAITWFSNYGAWIDVAAPGNQIYSTMPTYTVTMNTSYGYPKDYAKLDGTSMACPHVAGLAGLLFSKFPSYTSSQIRNLIENGADSIDATNPFYVGLMGRGRINALKSLNASDVAPTYTISGHTQMTDGSAVNGALVTLTGATSKTTLSGYSIGYYQFTGLKSGTYFVSASVNGLTFAPNQIEIDNLSADVPNQNFRAAPKFYIKGRLFSSLTQQPMANISVSLNGTALQTFITLADGSFQFLNLPSNNFVLSVGVPGFQVTPLSRSYSPLSANQDNQDFTLKDVGVPLISIVSPQSGAVVSNTVTLSAIISDNVSVKNAIFKIDGVTVQTFSSPPFSVNWFSNSVPDGSHSFIINATDAAGNTGVASRSFIVKNVVDITPPTVAINYPFNNQIVSGIIQVGGTGADDIKLSQVSVRVDQSVFINVGSGPSWTYFLDTNSLTNGPHQIDAKAIDSSSNMSITSIKIDVNNVQNAVYDPILNVPTCFLNGIVCDSGNYLAGRGLLSGRNELNQPNTIKNSCADGNNGIYKRDESIEKITVTSVDGSPLATRKKARIDVTVWAYSNADGLDLYYSTSTTPPLWKFLGTIVPAQAGLQTLTTTYQLPNVATQVIRANFRYAGSPSFCSPGVYDDHDDLAFSVIADLVPPMVVINSPNPNQIVSGTMYADGYSSDSSGVRQVDIQIDNGPFNKTTFPDSWNYSINTFLLSNAVHTFTARATDNFGNTSQLSVPFIVSNNTLPPVISNVVVSNLKDHSATVSFDTDILAYGSVEYGTSITYGNIFNENVILTAHSMPLSGLKSGTIYHFRAVARDVKNNVTYGSDKTFMTLPSVVYYDPNLKVPVCAAYGSFCDSEYLVVSRGGIFGQAEANYPNTINNSCQDGSYGLFHYDESLDQLVVQTLDGSTLAAGKTVRVDATVWAFGSVPTDVFNLYYAADAYAPVWVKITSIVPTQPGLQTLSATFTLPQGAIYQAIRGQFGYKIPANSPCSSNLSDDQDDLVFAVLDPTPPILTASYDPILNAPSCGAVVGKVCDTGPTLIKGRANLINGVEPNQPNTIMNSCLDGTKGVYQRDESIERLVVSSTDGAKFSAGKQVRIDASVWAYASFNNDQLDLYYASDARTPVWTLIKTITAPGAGFQVISTTFTLPTGSLQAIRANYRYAGSPSSCSPGVYDDHDDLVFAVNAAGVGSSQISLVKTPDPEVPAITVGLISPPPPSLPDGFNTSPQVGIQAQSAPTLSYGEIYSFPNPVRGKDNPTIHVECEQADQVDIQVFDVAGNLVQEATINRDQAISVDGHLAFEYSWPSGNAAAGVYTYAVQAKKGTDSAPKKINKLVLIK